MCQQHRATGRTFRTLLYIIGLASEGKHVVFSANTTHYAKDLLHTSINIIAAGGAEKIIQVTDGKIEFTSSRGYIQFVSHETLRRMRTRTELRGKSVVSDHYDAEVEKYHWG